MERILQTGFRLYSGKSTRNIKDIIPGSEVMNDTIMKGNMPVEMPNPFTKDKRLCILCKYKITPDYKNVRLLSQFVSRFTGKIYSKHITGLCEKQQVLVEKEIIKSMKCGLMPGYYRLPKYAKDPKLFDPDNPFRPHRY